MGIRFRSLLIKLIIKYVKTRNPRGQGPQLAAARPPPQILLRGRQGLVRADGRVEAAVPAPIGRPEQRTDPQPVGAAETRRTLTKIEGQAALITPTAHPAIHLQQGRHYRAVE